MAAEIRVLYVDDEPDLLDIARLFLEESGNFTVTTALSATNAIRLFEHEKFDAIISDYQMPGMDGIQFLVEVRTRFGQVPFILFTGKGREEVVIQAINSGADFYLQKGGEPEAQFAELSHKIKKAVEGRRAEEADRASRNQLMSSEADLLSHKTELGAQADELRIATHALEESRDKYLDLYDFAPVGYLTLSNKALITEVNLTGATLLGVERGRLDKARFSKFVAKKDSDEWHGFFMNVLNQDEKRSCTFILTRGDGFEFPARLEGIRITGSDGTTTVRIAFTDISGITHVEQTLRESEEKFRSLAESSPDYIMRYDRQCRHSYMNPAALRVSGLTEGQIIGKTHRESGFDETQSRYYEEKITRVFETGIPFQTQFAWDSPGGRVVLDWKLTPEFSEDGTVRSVLGVSRDITQLKRGEDEILRKNEELHATYEEITATEEELRSNLVELSRQEQALRESDANLRAILDATPFPVALVDLQDNNINYWSRSALTLFGHTAPTAAEWYQLAYPDPAYRQDVIDRWKPYLEKAKLSGQQVNTGEYRVTCRDGSVRICELYAMFLADKLVVTFNDITKRKRADEELQVSLTKYRTLFDTFPMGITISDSEGNIIESNRFAEILLGLSKEEHEKRQIDGREWKIIQLDGSPMPPEKYASIRALKEQSLISNVVMGIVKPNEDTTWISVTAAPVPLEGYGVVITYGDITERIKAEKIRLRTERQLNLLESITRHDIDNKITTILGYLSIAANKSSNSEIDQYLAKIKSSTNAIQSEIAFTRLYKKIGCQEPQWQNLDMALPRSQVPSTITLNADVTLVEVYADMMVEKVFSNLLDNSIRHGEHVSEIRVSSNHSDAGLMIIWEDNGSGIPAGEKEKIFERGFGKNTGLGLFLSREILAITGITIRETGEPGKGARFEMTVPKGRWR